jgi:hypothetical protein
MTGAWERQNQDPSPRTERLFGEQQKSNHYRICS